MIIDGKKIAEEVLGEVANEVKVTQQPLKLLAVLIGQHPGSKKFLELKGKAAQKVGIEFEMQEFGEDLTEGVFLSRLKTLVAQPKYSGVLIELPVPKRYPTEAALNAVPLEKDVDVLSEKAQKNFFSGDFSILPPAVEAVKIIFEKHNIDVRGKKVTVFGQGLLVGKPIAYWLYQQGVMVSVVNEFTKNPKQYAQTADILISGVGKAHLIKEDMVKEGAIVIDFGYERIEGPDFSSRLNRDRKIEDPRLQSNREKMVGDVDFEKIKDRASLITPVPGGVGPIVIAAVLKNLVKLAGKEKPAGRV
ncbi:MAG: bifunctional 5,10-methylenetetrahydrofolate dehydrogenase/5,10-methenyltetrahydrofolate cyclohydrolase [bacterium]|nr:bifunctional 5,10-methylenetetrahydrofolate dehydrogenase/5,10-methenyltetrahydrofolate cyclohydrolase [bacterium]